MLCVSESDFWNWLITLCISESNLSRYVFLSLTYRVMCFLVWLITLCVSGSDLARYVFLSLTYHAVCFWVGLITLCVSEPDLLRYVFLSLTYHVIRWSKTIVGQVDLTAKVWLSFCLELQSAKSTYQHVDLDLYRWNIQRLEIDSRSSEVIREFFTFRNDLQKLNWDQQDTELT